MKTETESSKMNISELDKKIVAISAVIGVEQFQPEHFVTRSGLFLEKGMYSLALEDANSAIRLDADCLAAYVAAAKASIKMRRFDESYCFFKEGIRIDPKSPEIIDGLKELQDLIISDHEQNTKEDSYNALSLCSQDIYPGDDELFRQEQEILGMKYKINLTTAPVVQTGLTLADQKEANKEAIMGHQCHVIGKIDEALYHCNTALSKDVGNNAARYLRAQINIERKNMSSAMQDLWLIPKSRRNADIWKMGGTILAGFDLPVMAEFWLRKATKMAPGGQDSEAATLFQKIRVKRIYGPLTAEFPVRVEFTEYGRAVVATDNLQPDDDAFDDTPVVIGQLLDCLNLPGCDHCGISLLTPELFFGRVWSELEDDLKSFVKDHWPDVSGVKCDHCEREKYCGASCKDEAWQRYHQIICPSVNTAASALYDLIENKGHGYNEEGEWKDFWAGHYSPIVLAKIWAQIITEAKRLMKQGGNDKPNIEHWARAKMPFRKFIAYGTSSAVERMPEVYQLMRSVFTDCGDGVRYEITETEFEARYYQATCNLQAFSSSITPKHKFMDKLRTMDDLRALQILKYLDTKGPTVSFAGMFPVHACLNHACDNNVNVMDGFVNGKPGVHVRVKRDIKPGEELFTTYIDTAMPRKLRRAWLYKSFNFWCFCKRCQFEGDDSSECTSCKKRASVGKKFPACSRCKRAWYCSTKCQKEAWVKGHKAICEMNHTSVYMPVSENKNT